MKKFDLGNYLKRIQALGGTPNVAEAVHRCLADALQGFEASSRSISMLCPSAKMACAMKVGSKLENAAKLTFDYSPQVEGYYFKVGELAFRYQEKGRTCGIRHRPDALRLLLPFAGAQKQEFVASDYIRFAEIKASDWLVAKSKDGDRYTFDATTQRYRCIGAEAAAAEMYGFGYDVLTERDFDPVLVANVEYLQIYYGGNTPQVPPTVTKRAREVVASDQGISFRALLASVDGLTADRFNTLLAGHQLYVPLHVCQLDFADSVQVFTDRVTCEALTGLCTPKTPDRLVVRGRFPRFEPNEIITMRGKNYRVTIAGTNEVQLRGERGNSTVITRQELTRLLKERQISSLGIPKDGREEAKKILLTTSPIEMNAALARFETIKLVLNGTMPTSHARARLPNFSNWLAKAKKAAREFDTPLVGLIDGRRRQGYHGSHLTPAAEALIAEVIESVYASARAPKKCSAYARYRELCRERNASPVSEKTFLRRIGRFHADKLDGRRKGSFASAASAPPVDHETLLMSGGRWFMHVAHADEYIADIAQVFPELGIPLGTAWLVVMIDSFSRTVLAAIATFEDPSYITTMVLLRECVVRWGRLPEILFVDNGAAFKNTSLALYAKYYGMQLCWRPPGKPRWGAEIERFVGDFNQRITNELPGATKVLNQLRRVSRSHHPDRLAVFGLKFLGQIAEEWCYRVFDSLPHAGLHGKTPAQMRTISQTEHGKRLHIAISDDPLHEIVSLPAPEGDGTAKVQAHDGVQVANLYYWNTRFHDPEIVGTRVDVRYDPFDITKVYAFVRDEWVQCDCVKLLRLRRLSRVDLCAASLEIRKGRSDYNKRRTETLTRVEAFLDATTKSGEELARLLRARESAYQFLKRISPRIDRGEDDVGPAAAATASAPIPKIPGFGVNVHG